MRERESESGGQLQYCSSFCQEHSLAAQISDMYTALRSPQCSAQRPFARAVFTDCSTNARRAGSSSFQRLIRDDSTDTGHDIRTARWLYCTEHEAAGLRHTMTIVSNVAQLFRGTNGGASLISEQKKCSSIIIINCSTSYSERGMCGSEKSKTKREKNTPSRCCACCSSSKFSFWYT